MPNDEPIVKHTTAVNRGPDTHAPAEPCDPERTRTASLSAVVLGRLDTPSSPGPEHVAAAIIDKALASEPGQRYRDAGALAADLKAFKSGVRITARSYSLLALLRHWTRRHRTLAWSALAVAVVAIAGVVALAAMYRTSSHNAAVARERLVQSYLEQGRRLSIEMTSAAPAWSSASRRRVTLASAASTSRSGGVALERSAVASPSAVSAAASVGCASSHRRTTIASSELLSPAK